MNTFTYEKTTTTTHTASHRFAVGDKVRLDDGGGKRTIVAIHAPNTGPFPMTNKHEPYYETVDASGHHRHATLSWLDRNATLACDRKRVYTVTIERDVDEFFGGVPDDTLRDVISDKLSDRYIGVYRVTNVQSTTTTK